MVKILYIGDVVGQPGRTALSNRLPKVIDRERVDFTVVNLENAAAGFGITDGIVHELRDVGVDVYTSGNHFWDKKEFVDHVDQHDNIIRPANYPEGNPGRGWVVKQTAGGVPVAVIQVMGQVFMPPCDNPFYVVDRVLKQLPPDVKCILVDIHAEATSEKQAMGRHLDGRVSGVFGTHTHVPTADDRLLPNGTAFQTDIGMTGAYDSIIGFRPDEILQKFLMNTPRKMEVAKRDVRLVGVLFEVDETTGRASKITRVDERLDD